MRADDDFFEGRPLSIDVEADRRAVLFDEQPMLRQRGAPLLSNLNVIAVSNAAEHKRHQLAPEECGRRILAKTVFSPHGRFFVGLLTTQAKSRSAYASRRRALRTRRSLRRRLC